MTLLVFYLFGAALGWYVAHLIKWWPVLDDPDYFIRQEVKEITDQHWFRWLVEESRKGPIARVELSGD